MYFKATYIYFSPNCIFTPCAHFYIKLLVLFSLIYKSDKGISIQRRKDVNTPLRFIKCGWPLRVNIQHLELTFGTLENQEQLKQLKNRCDQPRASSMLDQCLSSPLPPPLLFNLQAWSSQPYPPKKALSFSQVGDLSSGIKQMFLRSLVEKQTWSKKRHVKQEALRRLSGNIWTEASSGNELPTLGLPAGQLVPRALVLLSSTAATTASLCLEAGSKRASRGVYTQGGSFPYKQKQVGVFW